MNQQKLIAQIHNEIDTAQSRLLKEANAILLNNPQLGSKLAKIGFTNTPIVENYELYEKIQYYSHAYLFLKFLTEDELKRICNKYSLSINPIENYTGEVPEKNADEILNVQSLKSTDAPENIKYAIIKRDNAFLLASGNGTWPGIWGSEWWKIPNRIDGHHFSTKYAADEYLHRQGFTCKYLVDKVTNFVEDRQGLFICAPSSQFKGKNRSITSITPQLKDPIVFRYVRGGVQVITKWGLEASDESLTVPKLN